MNALSGNPDARVTVRRSVNHPYVDMHTHDFVELVVVFSGTALHRIGSTHFRLGRGDVFVVPFHTPHGYEEPADFNMANVIIRKDFFQHLRPAFAQVSGYHALFTVTSESPVSDTGFESRMHLSEADMELATSHINHIELESNSGRGGGLLMAEAYLTLLIGMLSHNFGKSKSPAAPVPSVNTRLGQLLSWLEQHASAAVRLGDLCQQAGMSERTLLRHFRRATGSTPQDYLMQIRLRNVCRLLENPSLNLNNDEIALRCGFDSGNYLARQFRKHMGCSPRAWAKSRKSVGGGVL
ncbi:MAG: helix-turn-helix domain-containing protein [Candidatus Methylacidiphilales bacterium]|nr:AraC family transcriptional regulator [Candidatus Methylacidiphilales bacterium]